MYKLNNLIFFLVLLIGLLYTNNVHAEKIYSNHTVAVRIYDETGRRVGTCRSENHVFHLYNLKEKIVDNPAEFMKQSDNDCYLYDNEGFAIGKCSSSKVILFRY